MCCISKFGLNKSCRIGWRIATSTATATATTWNGWIVPAKSSRTMSIPLPSHTHTHGTTLSSTLSFVKYKFPLSSSLVSGATVGFICRIVPTSTDGIITYTSNSKSSCFNVTCKPTIPFDPVGLNYHQWVTLLVCYYRLCQLLEGILFAISFSYL